MSDSDKELDGILSAGRWYYGERGRIDDHGGKRLADAKQRLNALIEKKVREAIDENS